MAENENYKFKVYNYKIKSIALKINGKITNIEPGQVNNFFIERDYDLDYLPVFMITILMGTRMYHNIIANPDTSFLNLQIQGFINKDGKGMQEGLHDFINSEFIILPIESTPFVDEKIYDDMENSPTYGEGTVVMSDLQEARTFILAKKSDLWSTKARVNSIMTSTNILSAAAFVMTKCKCTNVLMSPPDNPTIYNELLLLPVALINQLKYLNSYYGFYKEGSQIFFDFNRIYFLRNNAACTAYDKTEPKKVVFHINDPTVGSEYSKGSYTDDKNRQGHIISSSDEFTVEDLSTTTSEYAGNNSFIINNDGNVTAAWSTNGTSSFNIITTSTHNPYYTNETTLRLNELRSVVTIITSNCDLRLLTPNKQFQIIATNTKASIDMNKPYRLVSTKIMFTREGNYFTNVTEIQLKGSTL